jgi:hypothetical protein
MEDPKGNPNWGTITEASRYFGLSRQRIHQLIVKGEMGECRKVSMLGAPASGEIWLIKKPFSRTALVKEKA